MTDEDRLALAEITCVLADRRAELEELVTGNRAPGMQGHRREQRIADARHEVAEAEARQHELVQRVPDPESVRNHEGTTPAQRRAQNRPRYVEERARRIAELQSKLTYAAQAAGDKTASRQLRSRARLEVQLTRPTLNALLAEPGDEDLRDEDLCPDGVHLASSHGYVHTSSNPRWPCPAWPGQQAIAEQLVRMLVGFERDRKDSDLTRWELDLYCGHTVDRTANRSYPTYTAANGPLRSCEVCGATPAFITDERPLGPLGPTPLKTQPARQPTTDRRKLAKRIDKLQAELADLQAQAASLDEST